MRKVVRVVFLALLAIGLLWIAHILFLPNMEGGVIYKNREYRFLPSGRYDYDLSLRNKRVKKAVGRFNDAIIYTLTDDPDEFYLFPKVFWPFLGYNILCRQDFFPVQGDGEVEYMVLHWINKGKEENGTALRELKLDRDVQDNIIEAFQNKNDILTSAWEDKEETEEYLLYIYFSRPVGLNYRTIVVKYENDYGVLLDDGHTLVKICDFLIQESG